MKCATILIGIDDYDNYKKLNCAVKDLTDIAYVLNKHMESLLRFVVLSVFFREKLYLKIRWGKEYCYVSPR